MDYYWSSTNYNFKSAWHVKSDGAHLNHKNEATRNYARCFRKISDNNIGTVLKNAVIDPSTELMWQKKTDGIERNWKDAKRYCEFLELDGFNNWELPFELETAFPQIKDGDDKDIQERLVQLNVD